MPNGAWPKRESSHICCASKTSWRCGKTCQQIVGMTLKDDTLHQAEMTKKGNEDIVLDVMAKMEEVDLENRIEGDYDEVR